MANLNAFLKKLNKDLTSLLEQASQYPALSPDALRITLLTLIASEQETIQALEQQAQPNRDDVDEFEAQLLAQQQVQDQKVLAIHRHNLEVYQQMLAGERRYFPLELQHQIDDHQHAIELVKGAMAGELSEVELREGLRPLLIKVDFHVA